MSVVTTVSAFYLPASVMVILYYKVFDGLRKRARFGERVQRLKARKTALFRHLKMHQLGASQAKKVNRAKRFCFTVLSKLYGLVGKDYTQTKYHTEIVADEKQPDLLDDDHIDDLEINEEMGTANFQNGFGQSAFCK